ncbi:MAG: ROK family transcriptional regulator [Pseudomonadota bacterium]
MSDERKYPVALRGLRQPVGASQRGARRHNERLVLSQLHQHRSLSKAELARSTGLSAQAISMIIRGLEADGLIARGEITRGRIGQPSTPMALDPDGAYSVGLRVGRRSSDLVLMDFVGMVRERIKVTYPYPTPERVMAFVGQKLPLLCDGVERERVEGVGIGAPFQLYNWLDRLGAPASEMSAWRDFDLADAVQVQTGFATALVNDATCACIAEHSIGAGRACDDYAYFFIGSFIGGGVVMNAAVQTGPQGNAGAFGSLAGNGPGGSAEQLIGNASIYLLEEALEKAGHDAQSIWRNDDDWSSFEPHLSAWVSSTAAAMVHACLNICAVFDFPTIVVDGAFPDHVRRALVGQMNDAIGQQRTDGILVPQIIAGKVGADARAIGAAMLPIHTRYFLDWPRGA